jgi:hypothetical protein
MKDIECDLQLVVNHDKEGNNKIKDIDEVQGILADITDIIVKE